MSQHVSASNKSLHGCHVFRILQVGREALLVAVDGVEHQAIAIHEEVLDGDLPAPLAALGTLNLDDARSQVRQPQAR